MKSGKTITVRAIVVLAVYSSWMYLWLMLRSTAVAYKTFSFLGRENMSQPAKALQTIGFVADRYAFVSWLFMTLFFALCFALALTMRRHAGHSLDRFLIALCAVSVPIIIGLGRVVRIIALYQPMAHLKTIIK